MKQFIRNFKKQRTVGLLNICSLSLGIMVAVIVGLWTINELSFDKFHKNKDRIHRITMTAILNDTPVKTSFSFRSFGEQAKYELPVIEDMCRVIIQNEDISINNELYLAVRTFVTDENFFTFFTFPLREGALEYVLSAPDRVVVSQSAAVRYFPEEKNPVGRMIKYQGKDYAISGIMKDMPKNSSLQADFVFPLLTSDRGEFESYITFFLLQKGVMAPALTESLTQLGYRLFEPYRDLGVIYSLESLNDMHFSSQMMTDWIVKGNKPLVMLFVITALIILTISCINFANLFVSTSFIRAKTIGIKKTIGAKKTRLMIEFYKETTCYVLLAIVAGLMISTMVIPVFNDFTQSNLTLDFGMTQIYLFLALLLILVVALAGSFPALYMTRFGVIETLKGKFKGKKMSLLQKSLVITQFAASIILLIVVVFMQKQVNYILDYDLGFNKEHVIYIQSREKFGRDYRELEGEFLQESAISGITMKNSLPTVWLQGMPVRRIPEDAGQTIGMEVCQVSPNYFDFFDMKIVEGENYLYYESALETDVIINESAARLLRYEQPVGEMIADDMSGIRYTIRGVVRNAHTKSLHQHVDPQIYRKLSNDTWFTPQVFFKISGDPQRAISFLEQKWKERETEYPFAYHFLDDTYQQLYTTEMNAGKVFGFAMLIALMITVAGLFAMTYYATQRRKREIAIRKVYGASIKDIFVLLNKSFILWVGIAFAIACPVAYFGLQKWLDGFIIKTSLSFQVFLSIGVIALLITLFTTGYQTWKAAIENPVKSIYE